MMELPFAHRPKGSFRSFDPLDGIVFCKGQGSILWDLHGKSYLDFICGYSACNLGHAHPQLIQVASSQLSKLTFCTGANTFERAQLEQALANLWLSSRSQTAGGVSAKVWLCSSGARAVEVAWKLAYANRPGRLMRFDLGYHGRSLATAQISDTRTSDELLSQFQMAVADANNSSSRLGCFAGVIPFPRCGTQCEKDCRWCEASLEATRRWLETHAEQTSAMIIEPVIGSRGYYFAGRTFHKKLAALLREYQVQVISDEIQMGLGRLGPMLVSHEEGWDADYTILGKSLGGGIVSVAAVLAEASKMDALSEGMESETYAANAYACRIASESLQLLSDESLKSNVCLLGEQFRAALKNRLPNFLTIDGRGQATVIDLAGMPVNLGDASQMALNWVRQLKELGLLVHLTGGQRNRIALLPPLVIEEATIQQAEELLAQFWKNH